MDLLGPLAPHVQHVASLACPAPVRKGGERRTHIIAGWATRAEDDVAAAVDLSPPSGAPFLTAEWRDLIGITFPCPQDQLVPYLPPGATIDTLEGSPRVSLVAFAFSKTRVLRVPIPGHARFPEINLRFYVRYRGERAVVFIRELVSVLRPSRPSPRLRYNEPYVRVPMSCGKALDAGSGSVRVWHRFAKGSTIDVTASATGTLPEPDSPARWLTDHALGIGRRRNGAAVLYHVAHPTWALHEIAAVDLDVDFAAIYGPAWGVALPTPCSATSRSRPARRSPSPGRWPRARRRRPALTHPGDRAAQNGQVLRYCDTAPAGAAEGLGQRNGE